MIPVAVMTSASAAKSARSSAVSRGDERLLRPHLLERAEAVDRLVRVDPVDGVGRRSRDMLIGFATVRTRTVEESVGYWRSVEVDLVGRRRREAVLPHVADDADDREPRLPLVEGDAVADGLLAGPEVVGHRLVDERDAGSLRLRSRRVEPPAPRGAGTWIVRK